MEHRKFGNWLLDSTEPPSLYLKRPGRHNLGVALADLIVGGEHTDRWIHEVIGTMSGVTAQDIADLERAARELQKGTNDRL